MEGALSRLWRDQAGRRFRARLLANVVTWIATRIRSLDPKMAFCVRTIQAFCYRYPLSTPVVTSFGRMLNRPAVFVCVEDEDGTTGWGEVWSNFPSNGAEHRARLVNEVLAPAVAGAAASEPAQIFEKLTLGTAVLALQSGEQGPFAQAIA